MFYSNLLWLTGLILLFSLMAGRLERSWVSGPMLFTGLGLLLGPLGLDLLVLPIDGELLGRLAELTLALVLFSDAASADRLFVAWFGPRGMATIVFAVLVLDHDLPGGGLIVAIAGCTVLLSVIAHGVSANPWVARMGAAGG